MPYKKKSDMPRQVTENLPQGAQTIYQRAYNSALESYKEPSRRRGNASQEETASKVAWAAVKKKYEKSSGGWHRKSTGGRSKSR